MLIDIVLVYIYLLLVMLNCVKCKLGLLFGF
jgi:hypothetical protein